MQRLSKVYSDFALGLRFDDLPSEVIYQAKKCLLDFTGAAMAGSATHVADMVFGYYSEIGGKSETTVLAKHKKLPAVHSSLVNGVFAHALELDDGHRRGGLHPGSSIIPAALAAAELSMADGKELLTSIIAGYEVAIRIAKGVAPSHVLRGFHPTATVGTFGAATAASRLLGLGHEKTVMAMGIAGLFAGGLLQVMDEGGMLKPINPGKAASGGCIGAQLASRGMLAPERILEGDKGFLKATSDTVDFNLLTQDLGTDFEICNVYFKLHSCCRHIHPAIDALLQILNDHNLEAENIEHIAVETYPLAIQLCGHRPEKDTASIPDARFSVPVTLALAGFNRNCGLEVFSETELSRPDVWKLAQKVEVVSSEKWNALYPEKRGADVTVKAKGAVFQQEVELAKGDPENPVSFEELHDKFMKNTTGIMGKEHAVNLGENIMNLDRSSVSALIKLLG